MKDDLLVKLFAGHLVDRQTMLKELKHHRTQHQATLNTYRQIESEIFGDLDRSDGEDGVGELRYLTLLNGIGLENAWLVWCEQAISLLENKSLK
jgi:Virulence activator alpha C-term